MLILLGHPRVAYHCINVMLIFWCFDKFNFSCLKTYMIMTHVLLKPMHDHTPCILIPFYLLINVYHIDCFYVNMFIIVILDHLKPYACH